MNKISLLFITKDQSQQLERSTHYLIEELKKKINVFIWQEHGRLPQIVNSLPVRPDFILLNDFHPRYCPFIREIKSVDIPVGCIMHDMQYKTERRKSFIKNEEINYLFPHYRDAFLRWFPEYKERMIWFPHHVPTHLFKDYGLDKTINWLFMGSTIPHLYPLREMMIKIFKTQPGFVMHRHPGYDRTYYNSKQALVSKRYAEEINRAKIMLTSQSIYQYPILKYFESVACHTLLVANGSQELTDLGFQDGQTFIEVNESNLFEKANYYLYNEQERLRITKQAYNMVREHHSTEKRAVDLIECIKRVVRH